LTVLGTGFYAAQQHRHPDRNRSGVTASARQLPAEPATRRVPQTPAARSTESLPVAALADVDRVPIFEAGRTIAPVEPHSEGSSSVTNQPTVRRDSPPEQSSSAETPPTLVPGTAPQEAKKPAATNSPAKKHETKKKPAAKPSEKDFQPPNFAREYQPYSDHIEPGMSDSPGADDTSRQRSSKDNKDIPRGNATNNATQPVGMASQSGDHAPPVSPGTAPSRHRIAEGDTLRRLAEKYLGSRDRYLDIYQANQDILFDSQLIPIGVEIVIPAKTVIVAQAAADSTQTEDTGSRPNPRSKASQGESRSDSTPEPKG